MSTQRLLVMVICYCVSLWTVDAQTPTARLPDRTICPGEPDPAFNTSCTRTSDCSHGEACCCYSEDPESCDGTCQPLIKPGRCPAVLPNHHGYFVDQCPQTCADDLSCPGEKKCCPHGNDACGNICRDPDSASGFCPNNNPYSLYQSPGYTGKPCRDNDDCEYDRFGCCDDDTHGPVCKYLVSCPTLLCPPDTPPCRFGRQQDDQGCDLCECFDPCENLQCGPEEFCRITERGCSSSPCKFFTTECLACPTGICGNTCFQGYDMDPNTGCTSCDCHNLCGTVPNTVSGVIPLGGVVDCASKGCPDVPGKDFHCEDHGFVSVCCEICPDETCTNTCEFGFALDPDTFCPTCNCIEPCNIVKVGTSPLPGKTCFDGERCPKDFNCVQDQNQTFAVCCPRCDPLTCPLLCDFGIQRDDNDCPTCECYPDPCVDPGCDSGYTCEGFDNDDCGYWPCPPPYEPICTRTTSDSSYSHHS